MNGLLKSLSRKNNLKFALKRGQFILKEMDSRNWWNMVLDNDKWTERYHNAYFKESKIENLIYHPDGYFYHPENLLRGYDRRFVIYLMTSKEFISAKL